MANVEIFLNNPNFYKKNCEKTFFHFIGKMSYYNEYLFTLVYLNIVLFIIAYPTSIN